MNSPFSDNGIPLLTEILPDPAPGRPNADAPTVLLAPPIFFPDIALPEPSASQPAHALPAAVPEMEWDGHDRERMEAQISERITRQVLRRLDFVLEQRVRDSLADVLQVAVQGLTRDIRRGLHQTLEDTIGRAVAEELSQLQKTKK